MKYKQLHLRRLQALALAVTGLAGAGTWLGVQAQSAASGASAPAAAPAVNTVPGMPPVPNPKNVYSETGAEKISSALKDDLERIYVPNLRSGDVYVVDPANETLISRPVTVATFGSRTAAVTEGLSDGDTIVTLGVQKLEAGRKVRPLPLR